MWVLFLVPKKWLSYLAGKVMHLVLPGPLREMSIKAFAAAYKINLREAELPIAQYQSIGFDLVYGLWLTVRFFIQQTV